MQIILNYAADCAKPTVGLHLNQCGLWTFQNFCLEAVITAASWTYFIQSFIQSSSFIHLGRWSQKETKHRKYLVWMPKSGSPNLNFFLPNLIIIPRLLFPVAARMQIGWCIKQTEAALDLKGIHFTLNLSTNIHLKDHSIPQYTAWIKLQLYFTLNLSTNIHLEYNAHSLNCLN